MHKVSSRVSRAPRPVSPATSRELKLYSRVFNIVTKSRKRATKRKSRKSRKLTNYQKFVRAEFKKLKGSSMSATEKMKLVATKYKAK